MFIFTDVLVYVECDLERYWIMNLSARACPLVDWSFEFCTCNRSTSFARKTDQNDLFGVVRWGLPDSSNKPPVVVSFLIEGSFR